jgi:hypothetical protein
VICYMSATIASKCAAKHHGVVKTPATAGVSLALPNPCLFTRLARIKRRDPGCAVFRFNFDSRQEARLAKSCLDSPSRANHRSAARSSEK